MGIEENCSPASPCRSDPLVRVFLLRNQNLPVHICRHGRLCTGGAHARNFAAFEPDPALEDLTPDQRTGVCVILECKIYSSLPFIMCVQNSLCRDDLERHEKARSGIHGTDHLSKLQDSVGDILCLGLQFGASSQVQRHA